MIKYSLKLVGKIEKKTLSGYCNEFFLKCGNFCLNVRLCSIWVWVRNLILIKINLSKFNKQKNPGSFGGIIYFIDVI